MIAGLSPVVGERSIEPERNRHGNSWEGDQKNLVHRAMRIIEWVTAIVLLGR
jgi:hypothetical protein